MNNIKNTIKLNYNIITIFYVIISKKNRFLLVFIGFYWFLLVFIGFYCFLLVFKQMNLQCFCFGQLRE